jgi:hypothetical protein
MIKIKEHSIVLALKMKVIKANGEYAVTMKKIK